MSDKEVISFKVFDTHESTREEIQRFLNENTYPPGIKNNCHYYGRSCNIHVSEHFFIIEVYE